MELGAEHDRVTRGQGDAGKRPCSASRAGIACRPMPEATGGFTLLEVLLALTILAVIASLIYGSFTTAGRNIAAAEEVRDGTDRARTLLARLTNDIANAYVNPGLETFLYGQKIERDEDKQRFDSIYLTTLTNWRRPDSREMDLWEVGYFFQEKSDGTGRVLMRKEKRDLSLDVPRREGGVDYAITDAVGGLRFRYTTDGSTWLDDWKQGGLPRAVEVLLTLPDGKVYATQVDIRSR
jgi:general secretion pathway protein J